VKWLTIALIGAVLVGIAAGIALIMQNPNFWLGIGYAMLTAALPVVWAFVSKRMSPEKEAAWRREQITQANPQPMPSKFPKRDR